jgi:DNA-directed RNA polymerase subunit E'/Rpb7
MFYIDRNIETEVFFSHHDMDRASDNKEILKRLKEKVEGYCDQEYGYLIQVIANPTAV